MAGRVFNERTQVPLARDKVRFVGEPVAMVVAESRYLAEDALADILVDYEPLPAVVELEQALQPGAALVHDDLELEPGRARRAAQGRLRGGAGPGRRPHPAPPLLTTMARPPRWKTAASWPTGTRGPAS